MKPCSKTFRSANGGRHKPLGILYRQNVTLGNATFPTSMFVSAASNYTILLGNSFLATAQLVIDYRNFTYNASLVPHLKMGRLKL